MRFFFQRRPNVKHGSFRLTPKGERQVEKYIGTDRDTLVLFAFVHGSQTVDSLQRSTNLSRKEIEESMSRLVKLGRLTPTLADESERRR